MIGISKPTRQVTEERRLEIKRNIDRIGRSEFAGYIGENYYSLSNKLNGAVRLSEVYAVFYEYKIKEMMK